MQICNKNIFTFNTKPVGVLCRLVLERKGNEKINQTKRLALLPSGFHTHKRNCSVPHSVHRLHFFYQYESLSLAGFHLCGGG